MNAYRRDKGGGAGKATRRTVLTEGAIFPRAKLHGGVRRGGNGTHHVCAVGDIVILTDAEFEMYRAGGVSLKDTAEEEP